MDTKVLEKAELNLKAAVAEYEKLIAAETDYTDKKHAAKTKALAAAAALRDLRKQAMGSVQELMGSISMRGRPRLARGAPGVAPKELKTTKKAARKTAMEE